MRIWVNYLRFVLWGGGLLGLYPMVCFAGNSVADPVLTAHADTVYLGQHIQVSLSYRHRGNLEFLFPDSSYDFSPFEFLSKRYFYTQTDTLSKDSIVYTLSVYDLYPEYRLSLPVILIYPDDTLYRFSNEIVLHPGEVIQNQEDAQKGLLVVLDPAKVSLQWDWMFVGSVAGGILLLGLVIFIFFREKIIAWYQGFILRRYYNRMVTILEKLESEIIKDKNIQAAEKYIGLWKELMQRIEKKPYSTMTTKEISLALGVNQITSALQNFDRAIYRGRMEENLENSIDALKQGAKQRFLYQIQQK